MIPWRPLSRVVTSHSAPWTHLVHHSSVAVSMEMVFSSANIARIKEEVGSVEPERSTSWARAKGLKQAAVLVPLCLVNGQPSIMLTKRSEKLASYRGQVSFPGGMVDEADEHRLHTAIRETEEEIGLDPSTVDIWGSMLPVPGRNLETAVTPVLAYCGEVDVNNLQISEDEVAVVFTRTVESLCQPKNNRYTKFRGKAYDYTLPAFTGGEHRIWGMTAVILHQTLRLLLPRTYNIEIKFR